MSVESDNALKELTKRKKHQQLVNACARLKANPDFQLWQKHAEEVFGTSAPAFLGPDYSVTVAAIRDGQRSVFLDFESLASQPVMGDANQKPTIVNKS